MLISTAAGPRPNPPDRAPGPPFLHILTSMLLVDLWTVAILTGARWHLILKNYISLMMSDKKNLFLYLLSICLLRRKVYSGLLHVAVRFPQHHLLKRFFFPHFVFLVLWPKIY